MKIMLSGIMCALVSLFLLGICILNVDGGFFPDIAAFVLLILGIVLFLIGLFEKN